MIRDSTRTEFNDSRQLLFKCETRAIVRSLWSPAGILTRTIPLSMIRPCCVIDRERIRTLAGVQLGKGTPYTLFFFSDRPTGYSLAIRLV